MALRHCKVSQVFFNFSEIILIYFFILNIKWVSKQGMKHKRDLFIICYNCVKRFGYCLDTRSAIDLF